MIFNIYGTVSLIAGSSFYLRDNIERMIFTMINSNNYKEVLDKETGEIILLPANFIDNRQDYYIQTQITR